MASKDQIPIRLVVHQYEGAVVGQRSRDGFMSATAMCRAAGKLWGDYHRLASTQAFIAELSADMGIPISELIQQVKGGDAAQGTWVHPHVATHLAQWLSPRFAVQVAKWVHEWATGARTERLRWQQFHDRVELTEDAVPAGYFCIFREIAGLMATLITGGADVGPTFVPDISVGQRWAAHWKGCGLALVHGERIVYEHNYPASFKQSLSNPQAAHCYPDGALPEFRRWLRESYMTGALPSYLGSKVRSGEIGAAFASKTATILANKAAPRSLPPPT